MSEKKKEHK